MATFMIDTDGVRQKAKTVASLADEYDSIRTQLLNAATSMGAAYESADNKTYVSRITEFCTQMKEVSEKLRSAAQVMTNQSSTYDNTESNNASQANQLP